MNYPLMFAFSLSAASVLAGFFSARAPSAVRAAALEGGAFKPAPAAPSRGGLARHTVEDLGSPSGMYNECGFNLRARPRLTTG